MTEMLVVIGIIVFLVGILMPSLIRMYSAASDGQTRGILASAKAVADEYEVETGVAINHLSSISIPINWTIPKTYNQVPHTVASGGDAEVGPWVYYETLSIPKSGTMSADSGERFVWAATQLETTAKMLPSLGSVAWVDVDDNGFMELRDGWGHKIVYAAFVDHGDADSSDDYLPEFDKPFFASAGKDGNFGNAKTDPNDPALSDNLYSHQAQ
jgi:type II secretory pathway pseudopilin PulG